MAAKEKRLSKETERKAGDYLFDKGEWDDNQALDMRTRVLTAQSFKYLVFMGTLSEALESDIAGTLKSCYERLLIAHKGKGREEAVDILRQNISQKRTIETGIEPTKE